MSIYGYVRVSTANQKTQRQIDNIGGLTGLQLFMKRNSPGRIWETGLYSGSFWTG